MLIVGCSILLLHDSERLTIRALIIASNKNLHNHIQLMSKSSGHHKRNIQIFKARLDKGKKNQIIGHLPVETL